MVLEPIVEEIEDSVQALRDLKSQLGHVKAEQLFQCPVVYIHKWKHNKYLFDAYVGEANDILSRTQQHFQSDEGWHKEFKKPYEEKRLFIIGHPHFNKSLTLDIENRLIQYMTCMKSVHRLRNGRGNPQRKYYPQEEFDEIFRLIWDRLHKANGQLFESEQRIHDSALYKCSPLHQLSEAQLDAKREILSIIRKAKKHKGRGNLVFVEGEAGTGKSVLMSSLFYDLVAPADDSEKNLEDGNLKERLAKCRFIINHNEQRENFNTIFRRLGLSDKDDIVTKASPFINKKELVDVAFIDEAHLLCTQGNQGYSGKDQLEDILKYAKTTVIIFDENQILTREQYIEHKTLVCRKKIAQEKGFYYQLTKQFRIQASEATKKWIDCFSKDQVLLPIPKDVSYDLRVFDDVGEMYEAIKEKAKKEESRLSRVIASYDWSYNGTANRKPENYEVQIGGWHLPWNYETSRNFSKEQRQEIKDLAWAEQEHTIGEVGSTFTIQGFDLTYAGVILGPSISWDDKRKKIVIKGSMSKNGKVTSRRTIASGEQIDISDYLVRHELRVLMTRGVKGLYIYAVDPALRRELMRLQELNDQPEFLVDVAEELKFRRYLPVYSFRMACGSLGKEQEALPEGWMKVNGLRLSENLLIARADGNSMAGIVDDGQYCVLKRGPVSLDEGKVVLVMERDDTDHYCGGSFVLKKLYHDGDRILLKSANPDFADIVLDDRAENSVRYEVVAELIKVLGLERPEGA